jgi:hypothetical protein
MKTDGMCLPSKSVEPFAGNNPQARQQQQQLKGTRCFLSGSNSILDSHNNTTTELYSFDWKILFLKGGDPQRWCIEKMIDHLNDRTETGFWQ